MEQPISMAMDDQSLKVLAADSDVSLVWDFLRWLYHEWIVNKCKNTNIRAFHHLYVIKIKL